MFFIPKYILVLLVTILIDYFAAIFISKTKEPQKRKFYLIASIISTCFVLFVFKYLNFFNDNIRLFAQLIHWNYPIGTLKIILPLGLSFHTFQSLSYVLEVYKGKQETEYNFGIYALYVMFYPQLVAGPIERPQNLLHQFYEKHEFLYDDVTSGLKQMLWGFFLKVVIADRAAIYVNVVYNNQSRHNGTSLLVASILFAFQVYCDFAGYSSIAIGCARVMGFKLTANFNRPYFAKNMTEFWKRWHISLSTWFRDYVFVPLTGNRIVKPMVYFYLLLTLLLSGLWHGANWTFVIWGALHGLYLVFGLMFYKLRYKIKRIFQKLGLRKIYAFLSIFFMFTLAAFSGIFFRANSLHDALSIIYKILFERGQLFISDKNWVLVYAFFFLIVMFTVELVEEYKLFNNFSLFNNNNKIVRHFTYYSLVIIILMFGVFNSNEFIYFQF